MQYRHIGTKIITVVGVAVTIGLLLMMFFNIERQEQSILAQNERDMLKLSESVSTGLQTVMLAGYADIARVFADRLKDVQDVLDFRILRANGLEAFHDNQTIRAVNEHLGATEFSLREAEEQLVVLPPGHDALGRAVRLASPVHYYETDALGTRTLTFITPIRNQQKCYGCHGADHTVRGVLKLTTALTAVEADIEQTRIFSLGLFAATMVLIIILTNYMVRRTVVRPVELVTSAMSRASRGDLSQKVPVIGADEISNMANSFNLMIEELLATHCGMESEKNKLSTIILSAREGIVATNKSGIVVLVNPAAQQLLGKTTEKIMADGFLNILDEPGLMHRCLDQAEAKPEPVEISYRNIVLSVYAATIRDGAGGVVGSAALLREVTQEKQLENELRRLSTTDGLTGLYNRRFLDETLAYELSRAIRHRFSISILMVDIDHFKRFNDRFGHDQGDRILRAVGGKMKQLLRVVDRPCRYGGEEFLAILPDTSLDDACMAAERLRDAIAGMQVDGLKVTVSIGVAQFPHSRPTTAKEFITIADGALYAAKRAGRNRARLARAG